MPICSQISDCKTTKVTYTCYQTFTKGEDTTLNFRVKSDVSGVDLSNYDRVQVALYQYHTIYKVYEVGYDSEISVNEVTVDGKTELDINIDITESVSSMFLAIPLKMDVYLENTNNGDTIYISNIRISNVKASKYNSLNDALIYNQRDGFQDLIADFKADKTNIREGEIIQFTDLTNIDSTNWLWEYGDNNYDIIENPYHFYDVNGKYTVKLTSSNNNQSDIKIKKDYINVDSFQYFLNKISDIDVTFTYWGIKDVQTDIIKLRRSSDNNEAIIQVDNYGMISDFSPVKNSNLNFRQWANNYSDALYIVEQYNPDGSGFEQTDMIYQPKFDPINKVSIYEGSQSLSSINNDADNKWEPLFSNDFATIFYVKRDAVDNDYRHVGAIRKSSDTVRHDIHVSDGTNKSIWADWSGGSNTNSFKTDDTYSKYQTENTNFFTVALWTSFSNDEAYLYIDKELIETIDISNIDPTGFEFSVGQIRWFIGALDSNGSFGLKGKILSHAIIKSNITLQKLNDTTDKLKFPRIYGSFVTNDIEGSILAVSAYKKLSYYENRVNKIRRTSDDQEINVIWDSNYYLSKSSKLEGSFYDLGSWKGSADLHLSSIFDGSEYEWNLTQATLSNQPKLNITKNNYDFDGQYFVENVNFQTITNNGNDSFSIIFNGEFKDVSSLNIVFKIGGSSGIESYINNGKLYFNEQNITELDFGSIQKDKKYSIVFNFINQGNSNDYQLEIYLNGKSRNKLAPSSNLNFEYSGIRLGNDYGSNYLNGYVKEFYVYNKILNQTEIDTFNNRK